MHSQVTGDLAGGWRILSSEAAHEVGRLATGDGAAVEIPNAAPFIVAVILGAFCGAVVGFILARIVRFVAYLAGRNVEGNFLILIGALAGAGLLAWMAATGRNL